MPKGTILDFSDEELYRLFFSDRWQYESIFTLPDYSSVHSELNMIGVTLKMLYKKYTTECKETPSQKARLINKLSKLGLLVLVLDEWLSEAESLLACICAGMC